MAAHPGLLAADDPPTHEVVNPQGDSPWVLVCDHASNRIPRPLGTLGLSPARLQDHIAWDPGAAEVARELSRLLDAPLVLSGYSRLVIDCNRPPQSPESVPAESDGTLVPGNAGLDAADRRARRQLFFDPYHDAIERLLDDRGDVPTLFLSIHSFAPTLAGEARPWPVGVCSFQVAALADALRAGLQAMEIGPVGNNEPYAIETTHDHGIPVHGEGRGLPSAMIEIRQDGLESTAAAIVWAQRLAQVCDAVAARMDFATR